MAFPLSFKPKAAGDLIKSEEWNELMEEIDKRVKIAGDSMTGPLTINPPNALNFGLAPTRQMINLWATEYGIGIQGGTQYYRTGGNFAWFRGGAHADTPLNPGGGTQLMALNSAGDLLLTARTNPNGGDAAKCRALVDGGNLLILNYENDYSNGVQIGGALPGTTTNRPSNLRVTGALSFGESGVDNPIGIARVGNDLRVTMRADAFTAGTAYEFRIGHSYLWRSSGGIFGGIGIINSGFDSKFRASSTGDVYAETALHGTGADYAELFESENGKPIQAGVSVVLGKEGKVRAAKDGETPLGIISVQPGVIGNSPMNWPHRYVRNEFGEIIMEDAEEEVMMPKKKNVETSDPATGRALQTEVDELDENGQVVWVPTGKKQKVNRPKMNPDYDPNKTYIPRNERPEWQKVGLIGQLRLRKGQPIAPNWIKIKDISPEVELWLIK